MCPMHINLIQRKVVQQLSKCILGKYLTPLFDSMHTFSYTSHIILMPNCCFFLAHTPLLMYMDQYILAIDSCT